MKLIIAGSRNFTNPQLVANAVRVFLDATAATVTEVVSGGAPGVDTLGEEWANAACLPIKRFPADWDRLGKAAGPIRNQAMADYADALLVIWDGDSPGSEDILSRAQRKGLPVLSVVLTKPEASNG